MRRWWKKSKKQGLQDEIQIVKTGCFGMCKVGPNMVVYPDQVFYTMVQPEDVEEIVQEHLLKAES